MEDGVEDFEHLFGELPLCDGDDDACACVLPFRAIAAIGLELLLHLIQQLTQELLRVLLVAAAERWDDVPHRVQHGERRHERPAARPHHPEQGVQLLAQRHLQSQSQHGLFNTLPCSNGALVSRDI